MILGTLDWGTGGIDLHRRLVGAGVADAAVYLSDTAATPYGELDADALAARVADRIAYLRSVGCTHVVLGCNAASTTLDHPRVAGIRGIDVRGVIAPTIAAIRARGPARVTVLGGARTVASGRYETPLREAGIEVRARVAQPLSALVEAGVVDGPEVDAALEAILGPVRDTRTLVPACTHYIALTTAFERQLPALECIVDPARETAAALTRDWGRQGDPNAATRHFTTGDPGAARTAAARAFGVDVEFQALG